MDENHVILNLTMQLSRLNVLEDFNIHPCPLSMDFNYLMASVTIMALSVTISSLRKYFG